MNGTMSLLSALLLLYPAHLFASLQQLTGYVRIPPLAFFAGAHSSSSFAIAADDSAVANILVAPKTGSISKVKIRTGSVTVSAQINISLETVDATTGTPSGTLWATNTSASIASPSANTDYEVTLTASASVNADDPFAIVVRRPTGGTASLSISYATDINDTTNSPDSGLPYAATMTLSVWTKSGRAPSFAIFYSGDSTYTPAFTWPLSAGVSSSFNSGTNPNHRALKFKVPFKARLAAVVLNIDPDGNYQLKLFQSTGGTNSLLWTGPTMDKDIRATTGADFHQIRLSTPQTILPNTWYRLAVVPVTATSMTLYEFQTSATKYMDAIEGGQDFILTTANNPTDGGADSQWTDTATQRPWISLCFDQLSNDSSSGGTWGF